LGMFLSMVKRHCAEHPRFMQQAIDRNPMRIRATHFCIKSPVDRPRRFTKRVNYPMKQKPPVPGVLINLG
jgi:hypothetical protein